MGAKTRAADYGAVEDVTARGGDRQLTGLCDFPEQILQTAKISVNRQY